MSDVATRRRIRAQASPADGQVLGFLLDEPLQTDAKVVYNTPDDNAPLSQALFAVNGVRQIEISGTTIWVRKSAQADWASMKPAIATAIRAFLDETDMQLSTGSSDRAANQDAELLRAVEELLEQQVNPSIAAHGGQITVERVEGTTVYLRMSGGCQGCAASSATLRQGVERMLRAALPAIDEIVDVTDHDAGLNPYYARPDGKPAMLKPSLPDGVVGWQDGQIVVDPEYLAPRLGLTPETLRAGLHNGDVVGVTETGVDDEAGQTRIILRSPTRAWAAEIGPDGRAWEVPPPKPVEAAANGEQALAARVRRYLEELPSDAVPITYGSLARALGMWMPGSVGKVTRALETTMREDARANRPFIAANVVSRAGGKLPGKGFFDLARALSRGRQSGETDAEFHAKEMDRVSRMLSAGHSEATVPQLRD